MSHLWSFMEEVEQGILVPPLELILLILCLRHAIDVVFGRNDLQPLTVQELSPVKDIINEKFSFPSAKEARAFSKEAFIDL